MNSVTPLPSIFDTQSLAGIKKGLRTDDPQALKAAAQQFEAIFLQMMMKSMRAASPQDSVFDNDQSRFYQELLDSQLSQVMAAKGGTGLAAVIERQLSRGGSASAADYPEGLPLMPPPRDFPLGAGQQGLPLPRNDAARPLPLEYNPARPATPGVGSSLTPESQGQASQAQPSSFVSHLWPQAVMASQTTGIPPQFLIAHAALESGWGRSEPRFADGRQSHNLFGIKAGSNWPGESVDSVTTEYVNGVAERRVERFRAYGSYAESFEDYARLLAQSPRYAGVVGTQDATSFAHGLQRAGYATDPAYANKLLRVIGSLGQKLTG